MHYQLLGSSGLVVSRLAFGAMTFTSGNTDMASIYKVGADLAQALVDRALAAGVTLFDTADGYANGESEELLGIALRNHRDDVVIATKVGFRTGPALVRSGLSRRHILWSIDQSLKRLGTEWVDLYIAHREDPFTPLEETLCALDAVVRAGKARYLGVSNWPAWQLAAAIEFQRANGLAPFTHGQMYYSLLGRDVEREIVPMMRSYRLGLTVWSPLASGFLSGKYTRENLSDPENRFSGFDFLPFDKERAFALVEMMRGIAAAHSCSVAQVAIAWLLSRDAVTSVIIGATKGAQLDDNLTAVDIALTPAEIAHLDDATSYTPTYPTWFSESVADDVMRDALA